MKDKNHTPQHLLKNKWLRFGFSLTLAFSLALILLLIPVKAGTVIHLPVPDLSQLKPVIESLPLTPNQPAKQTIDLSLPFGASLVHATNGLTITKSAPATVDQGGTLTYTLVVTNDTSQDLIDALITDTIANNVTCANIFNPDSPPNPFWTSSCSSVALWDMLYIPSVPFLSISFTNKMVNVFTYTVTIDEPLPDEFPIINSSYTISSTDGTSTYTDTGTPVTVKVNAPKWVISKTVSSDIIQPGEYLTYTITITNDGHLETRGAYTITEVLPNNTVTNSVIIQSPGISSGNTITWVLTESLAALGGTKTLTYAVQVTSPLTDGETIVNQTYSITGGNVFSGAVGLPITTTVASSATLVITKTASADPVQAGDFLTYTITITNDASAQGPAFGVIISDTLPGEVVYQSAGFVGAATGIYTDTGDPTILWELTNPLGVGASAQITVTVQVTSPMLPGFITNTFAASATNASPVSDTLTTEVTSTNIITLNKRVSPAQVAPGGTVTYTITLTNSGNSIATINLTDVLHPDFSPTSYIQSNINLPGRSFSTTETITTTVFTATAPITPGIYYNQVVTATYDLTQTTISNIAPVQVVSPVITITKIANVSTANVGDTITYTYTITNPGNITLTNITLTDNPLGPITPTTTTLGPSTNTTATVTTVVTEGALPGPITNTVTVTGTYLSSNFVTATATETVAITYTTEITVVKIATPTSGPPAQVGDTITYTYYITNSGTITLYTVTLDDDQLGPLTVSPATLGPNQSATVTSTIVVTEGRLPGPITNTATVTGTNILSETTTASDTVTVPLTFTTEITVVKIATPTSGPPAQVGDTITYTYDITNTGSITLYTVILNDDQLGSLTVSPSTLGPNESATVTDTTVVTESHLPGPITNTVTVTGTNILSQTTTASDTVTVPLAYTTEITVVKIATPSSGPPAQIGDTITYTYRITNTGTVTLSSIILTDDQLGAIPVTPSTLAPNQSTMVTGTTVVTESHLPGPITNIVTVTGTNLLSQNSVATATISVPLTYTTGISLEKSSSVSTATIDQMIIYTYRITNTGSISLNNVTLTDDKLGPITFGVSLPPGATTITTTYTVSQSDFTSYPTSILTNTATVTGTDFTTATFTDTDSVTVTLVYTPEIRIVKTADITVATFGQTITYTYYITNTGNVTLTNVTLTDDKLGPITPTTTTLGPNGDVTTGTITYTVQAGDVSAGAITNTAIVTGDDILGRPITDTNTLVVGVEAIITAITATNSSPNAVNSATFFTVTTSITNGVTYTWDFGDGSLPGSGSTPVHTYTTVGTYTAVVTAANAVSTISTTTVVTITPGPIASFVLIATTPQTAGISFTIVISAADAYGNLIDTFNQSITISDTTGTIAPISVTLVNGITVTNFTVYSATSPALDTIQAISGTITGTKGVEIRPNVPTTVTVQVLPNSGLRVCQNAAVTTTVIDNWGNRVPDTPMQLFVDNSFPIPPSVPYGNATITPTAFLTTNVNGLVNAFVQGTGAGNISIGAGVLPSGIPADQTGDINFANPPIPTAITVTVTPPSVTIGNTAVVSAEVSSCAGPVNGTVVTFTVGSLASITPPGTATTNASGIATVTVTAGITPGVTTITGTVEGPLVDTTPFTILPASAPVLTITKTANPASGNDVQPGSTIVYQLVISNGGTATATNVVITDALHSDVGFVTGSIVPSGSGPVDNGGGVITFSVSSLGIGASVTATIEVTVTASMSGTVVTNTATASSIETGNIGNSNMVTHQVITNTAGPVYLPIILKGSPTPPDLTVSNVVVSNLTPNTGDPVVITVTLHNTGTNFATPFWVDLYLSTTPINPAVNQTWEDNNGNGDPDDDDGIVPYGVAWKVYGMPTDGDFPITNLNPNDLAGTCDNFSNFIPNGTGCWPQTWKGIPLNNFFRDPGTYYLYVRVDSFDDPAGTDPNGEVVEANESNNLYNNGTPIVITVGGASLPLVSGSVGEAETPDNADGRPSVRP